MVLPDYLLTKTQIAGGVRSHPILAITSYVVTGAIFAACIYLFAAVAEDKYAIQFGVLITVIYIGMIVGIEYFARRRANNNKPPTEGGDTDNPTS